MKARTKRKTILSILLCCMLVFTLMPAMAFAEGETPQPAFGGGTGTKADPWQISSADDLVKLSDFVNEGKAAEFEADEENNPAENFHGYYFKQTKNIDLSGVNNWEPIGYSGSSLYFAGNYDGGGYKISNATSTGKNDKDGYATAGIFGWVVNGSVSNLKVVNANFSAEGKENYSYVGGIAGVVYGSSIINCTVTGSNLVSSCTPIQSNCVGGIAGYSTGGTFEKCASVNNNVTGQDYGGGFVGEIDDDVEQYSPEVSKFTNCYVTGGSVTGDSSGGFAGMVHNKLTLENSFVYDTRITNNDNSTYKNKGILAGYLYTNGSTFTASLEINNCYYGVCGDVTENAGSETLKTKEDFTNGTVAKSLGNAYVQGPSYPVFDGPADYSKVDEAIAKANALNKSDYKDFSAVDKAVNDVDRSKKITDQDAVDKMAQAIEDAIKGLEKTEPTVPVVTSPADYSKVDAAIAKANSLNKNDYKDFSAVDKAVNAVVRGKDSSRQSEVDAMAQAIEDALNGLKKKTSSDPQKNQGSVKDQTSGNNTALMLLKGKSGKNNIKLTWKKIPGASKYVVYGTKCNTGAKQYKFEKLKNTKKLSYTQTKLKKGTYYRYHVYAVNAKGDRIASSKTVHVVTAGGKYGNPKAVKVQNAEKIKTLKIGKRVRIKAVQVNSKKKTQKHCGLRYDSSNKAVATVNSKGVISAKKKGKAAVYVYAQNGIYKKITVTVR